MQFPDGEVLQYTLLHLFKIVVILGKHLLRLLYLNGILRRFTPRDIHDPVQVGPDECRLGGIGVHHLESVKLLEGLFLRIGRQLCLLYLLPEILKLLPPLIKIPQLRLDRPQLLPQVILPLASVHLLFRLGLYLDLHLRNLKLLQEKVIDHLQPLNRSKCLKNMLGVIHL